MGVCSIVLNQKGQGGFANKETWIARELFYRSLLACTSLALSKNISLESIIKGQI